LLDNWFTWHSLNYKEISQKFTQREQNAGALNSVVERESSRDFHVKTNKPQDKKLSQERTKRSSYPASRTRAITVQFHDQSIMTKKFKNEITVLP